MAKESKVEWKAVVGYEGLYQVSSTGLVRSTERDVMSQQNFIRHITAKAMAQTIKKRTGKLSVVLLRNGGRVHKDVSTIVAMAFIPNIEEMAEVGHNDYDILNNNVDNLRWQNPPLTKSGKPMSVCKECKDYYSREEVYYLDRLCPSCKKDYKRKINATANVGTSAKYEEKILDVTDAMRKEATDASWMGSASIYW